MKELRLKMHFNLLICSSWTKTSLIQFTALLRESLTNYFELPSDIFLLFYVLRLILTQPELSMLISI